MAEKSFLTNRHFVVAMIVAPILAVIAYFGVDRAVSEPPQQAVAGQSYPLAASSNCRYSSGRCTMKNGDFKFSLTTDLRADKVMTLNLESRFPLETAAVALVPDAETDYPPMAMSQLDESGMQWTITTSVPNSEAPQLRVAVTAQGSMYYGQSGLEFTQYETSYQKDFRHEE